MVIAVEEHIPEGIPEMALRHSEQTMNIKVSILTGEVSQRILVTRGTILEHDQEIDVGYTWRAYPPDLIDRAYTGEVSKSIDHRINRLLVLIQ
jgi:hypothetical protein